MIDQLAIKDEAGDFVISLFRAGTPSRSVLFAPGAGGDPFRHRHFLTRLADQGITVVAPQFNRLHNSLAGAAELALRLRRLEQAFAIAEQHAEGTGKPVAGLGHSLGATILIGLAGGHLWTRDKAKVDASITRPIDRMVLFAPALDFVTAPDALADVVTSMQVWAGSLDSITPAASTGLLACAPGIRCDVHVVEGAGHFSFMDEPPPTIVDPMMDREAFLARLATAVGRYLLE
jgi:alpha-beta hydrolase superfamily lysophospholipase